MPDEFEWVADWDASENPVAKVTKIQYGDGYVQRQTKGMNPVAVTWNLTFKNRDDAEATAIREFLEERYGVVAFTWTPPGQTQKKWICDSWPRSIPGYNVNNFTLKFELVYEP